MRRSLCLGVFYVGGRFYFALELSLLVWVKLYNLAPNLTPWSNALGPPGVFSQMTSLSLQCSLLPPAGDPSGLAEPPIPVLHYRGSGPPGCSSFSLRGCQKRPGWARSETQCRPFGNPTACGAVDGCLGSMKGPCPNLIQFKGTLCQYHLWWG